MATNNAWNSTLTTQYAIQVGNSTGQIASLATGTSNQLLMSGGAAANPAWSTATFPATSVTGDILYASANNVWSLLAPGSNGQVLTMGASVPAWSGSSAGITQLDGDSGHATGSTITLSGTANQITTTGDNASTINFSIPSVFIAPGSIEATTSITADAGNITATLGDMVLTSGNLDLGDTTGSTAGVIASATRGAVFHTYDSSHNGGLHNLWVGENAGNFTNTGQDNVVVGSDSTAKSFTTPIQITVVGSGAGRSMTSDGNCELFGALAGQNLAGSSLNQIFGSYAGRNITTGSNNVLMGAASGYAYTSTETGNVILGNSNGVIGESNIMRLGNDTTGQFYATPTSQTYMAGVWGNSPGAAEFVIINASGQLGTSAGGGGGIATLDGDSGHASGATVNVVGTTHQITTTGDNVATLTLSIPSVFVAPGSVEVTSGFTIDAGTVTLTPLNTSGMVVNSAAGVITTAATTNHALQLGNASGQLTSFSTGTSGQLLQSAGAADPAWTTATFPGTAVTGDLLYASGANTWALLAPGSSGKVLTMGASVPAWQTAAAGTISLINGTVNQISVAGGSGPTATLSLSSTLIAPGSVEVTSGFTIDAGTVTIVPFSTAGMIVNSAAGVITSSATTANAVQVGLGGQLTSLSVATDGQVLLGDTASAPNWVTPTAGNGLSVTASDTVLAWALSAPVSIANGGTNATSMTNTDGVVYYDGTSLVTTVVGSAGQLLQSNGAGFAPTWVSGASGISTIDGDSGTASGATISILGTANEITTTGNNATHLTLSTPSVFIAPGSAKSTTTTEVGTDLLLQTTSSSTTGVVKVGGSPWLHSFGTRNVFLGLGAGNFTLTAQDSVCIGNNAGNSMTSGGAAVYIGSGAGQNDAGAGTNQVGIGFNALNSYTGNAATGNTAVGVGALTNLLTGEKNVAVGNNAGSGYTASEDSNICLGNDVIGAAGESHVLRIGNQGTGSSQQNVAVIAGIYLGAGNQHGVLINSTGLLGTVISSRRFKNTIEDMGDVSSDIYKLRPVKFFYNSRPEEGQQTGLIAEEVEEVMPSLAAYDSTGQVDGVRYHELPALLLNELQKLAKRVQELESKLGV